jgi:hypothetical protein
MKVNVALWRKGEPCVQGFHSCGVAMVIGGKCTSISPFAVILMLLTSKVNGGEPFGLVVLDDVPTGVMVHFNVPVIGA